MTFDELVERHLDSKKMNAYPSRIPEWQRKAVYIPFSEAKKNAWRKLIEPKKVIFNDPATIVFWHDGTKTVVKAIDEPFDPEKGLAMAISKKYLGNEGNYYNTFKKWLPEEGVITFNSFTVETFKDLEKKTKLVFDTLSCLAKKE